jgi:hypothetical protein
LSQQNPALRRIGIISFSIGILLGILLILVRAWPDMESTFYGFVKYDYPSIPSLSCPVLMTSLDHQPVTIRLHNPLNQNLNWYVNAQFSTNFIIDTKEERVVLQPGETRTISWEVGRENVDLNNFIFANVFISPAAALKMRASTCGTLVLNLPFKGGPTIFFTILVLTVLVGGFGLWLWQHHIDMSNPTTVSLTWWMRFVASVITVGVVAGILNWWYLGILTLLLTLLSFGVFLFHRDA